MYSRKIWCKKTRHVETPLSPSSPCGATMRGRYLTCGIEIPELSLRQYKKDVANITPGPVLDIVL